MNGTVVDKPFHTHCSPPPSPRVTSNTGCICHLSRLDGNTVKLTLAIPKLDVKGDFQVKFKPVSHKFGIDVKIGQL